MDKLAERQHSLIGREQALAYGMTRGQIDARLRSGKWEAAARGVYRVAGSVPTWEQKVMAAVLATGGDAAASRRSAAALWKLPGFRPGPVEVTQARGQARETRPRASTTHASSRRTRSASSTPSPRRLRNGRSSTSVGA